MMQASRPFDNANSGTLLLVHSSFLTNITEFTELAFQLPSCATAAVVAWRSSALV